MTLLKALFLNYPLIDLPNRVILTIDKVNYKEESLAPVVLEGYVNLLRTSGRQIVI